MVQDRVNDMIKCAGIVARVIRQCANKQPDSITATAYDALRHPERVFAAWSVMDNLQFFSQATTHEFNITGRE